MVAHNLEHPLLFQSFFSELETYIHITLCTYRQSFGAGKPSQQIWLSIRTCRLGSLWTLSPWSLQVVLAQACQRHYPLTILHCSGALGSHARHSFRGKFSVIRCSSWRTITTFTSNSRGTKNRICQPSVNHKLLHYSTCIYYR